MIILNAKWCKIFAIDTKIKPETKLFWQLNSKLGVKPWPKPQLTQNWNPKRNYFDNYTQNSCVNPLWGPLHPHQNVARYRQISQLLQVFSTKHSFLRSKTSKFTIPAKITTTFQIEKKKTSKKVMKNHWKSCFPGRSSRSCPTPRALTISSLDSLESSFQELSNASKLDIIASRDGQHAQVLFQTWNHHFLTILHKIFKKNRRKTMIFVHFPFEFTHP